MGRTYILFMFMSMFMFRVSAQVAEARSDAATAYSHTHTHTSHTCRRVHEWEAAREGGDMQEGAGQHTDRDAHTNGQSGG